MAIKRFLVLLTLCASCVIVTTVEASAFCGVIQETATARNVNKALQRAQKAVNRKIKPLRRENGSKLQLDEAQKSCIGGALAVDENGVETEGRPSCTVTQSFCVNP